MTDFNNLFPDVREQGSTLIVQCQLVMLRMLKILDYICRKHDIEYFLVGGSLLGAIRHKGFIPWDDDLDIGMTRENYEKFEFVGVPELPMDIFFQNYQTDKAYPYSTQVEARLRDKYSSYTRKNTNWHEGLQIDIFIYDKAFFPNNFLIICENMILGLLGERRRAQILKRISNTFPSHFVYASSYLQKPGMLKYGDNYIRPAELRSIVKTKFEDMETFIPAGWHNCLQRQYGNYMVLPPAEKQRGHHGLVEKPDPFMPCVHKDILIWKDRHNIIPS
jgi:lipopolysaccharide cholinephosphotransferase